MRGTKLVAIGATAVFALTACDEGGERSLGKPFTDVAPLVSAAKAGVSKSKSTTITMVAGTSASGMTATGSASYDGANSKFSIVTVTDGEKWEMRYVDTMMYSNRGEAQMKDLGATTPWIKIAPDRIDQYSTIFRSLISKALEPADPTRTLEQVAQAGKLVSSDQPQLDGRQVNHYVLDLDVQKSLDQFTGYLVSAKVHEQAANLLKGKNIHLPCELWVDKDQLPVQVKMDSAAFAEAVGAKLDPGDGLVTTRYTNWGAPGTITAPPADQVTDMSELSPKFGG